MAVSDQIFVMLLVPILALIPQLSVTALKKMEKHRKLDRRTEDQDTFYFGL
jgi:hypothetical protein